MTRREATWTVASRVAGIALAAAIFVGGVHLTAKRQTLDMRPVPAVIRPVDHPRCGPDDVVNPPTSMCPRVFHPDFSMEV